MSTQISVTQAIGLIGSFIKDIEAYTKEPHTVTTTVALVEGLLTDIANSGISAGDLVDVVKAVQPYLGLIEGLTAGK